MPIPKPDAAVPNNGQPIDVYDYMQKHPTNAPSSK
jgi:hypothetical protein